MFGKFIVVTNRSTADLVLEAKVTPEFVSAVVSMIPKAKLKLYCDDVNLLCYIMCWYALKSNANLCPWRALTMARMQHPPGVTDAQCVEAVFATFGHRDTMQPKVLSAGWLPSDICVWNAPVLMGQTPLTRLSLHNVGALNNSYTVAMKRRGVTCTLVISQDVAHIHNTNVGCAAVVAGLTNGADGTTVLFGELLDDNRFEVSDCVMIDSYLWLNGRTSHFDRAKVLQLKLQTLRLSGACQLTVAAVSVYALSSFHTMWSNEQNTSSGVVFIPSQTTAPVLLWEPRPLLHLLCAKGALYATGSARTIGPLLGAASDLRGVALCALHAEGWRFVQAAPLVLYPDSVSDANLAAATPHVSANQLRTIIEAA